jgi:hypothetical protein
MIDDGLGYFAMFENGNAKKFEIASPSTVAKVIFKKGDGVAWGWASTIVRASPEFTLAFFWDTLKRASARDDDLEKVVEETPSEHNQLIYIKKAIKRPLKDRDFLTRGVWKATEDGFVYVLKDEENGVRPRLPGVVRATLSSVLKLSRTSAGRTKIEYVIHPDAGGNVPSYVMNLQLAKNLSRVTETREFFQSLRGLHQWDSDDSKAVGEVMVIKTKEEEHRGKGETKVSARMRELFKKYKGLKEIGEKYEFFQDMMTLIVENKLRSAGDVSTRLCNVSKKEGRAIGAGLAMSLAGNLTSDAAVDEWILKYPALKELDREEIWFRQVTNVVANRLLTEVPWGLKFRVFIGACFSLMDMVSDLTVVFQYFGTPGSEAFGYILLGMICSGVFLQLVIVLIQNWKKKDALPREILIVITCMKPAFDARNVILHKEQADHTVFDAKLELVCSRCNEMFAEAIPVSSRCALLVAEVPLLTNTFHRCTTGRSSSNICGAENRTKRPTCAE